MEVKMTWVIHGLRGVHCFVWITVSGKHSSYNLQKTLQKLLKQSFTSAESTVSVQSISDNFSENLFMFTSFMTRLRLFLLISSILESTIFRIFRIYSTPWVVTTFTAELGDCHLGLDARIACLERCPETVCC